MSRELNQHPRNCHCAWHELLRYEGKLKAEQTARARRRREEPPRDLPMVMDESGHFWVWGEGVEL